MVFQHLNKPILGLSPMDGVTDAAFRYMVAKYSHPDVIFTEFTNVEGLSRGVVKLLSDFVYSPIERPVIAQVFGTTPEDYYKVALIVCEMGFDGIDINMGCPDNDVAKRGGGAALILNPPLATKIIKSVQRGVLDWSNGKEVSDVIDHPEMLNFIETFTKTRSINPERKKISVSVKTRIGYDNIIITEWVKQLLETEIENISIHGRTLKQMYTGVANWEEIGKAAEIIKKTNTTVLGNGDIKTRDEAILKSKQYNLDGVLIGRAVFGNPYFFNDTLPILSIADRLNLCLEHAQYYANNLPNKPFIALRKHMAWYMKGFEGASDLRNRLVRISNISELQDIIREMV